MSISSESVSLNEINQNAVNRKEAIYHLKCGLNSSTVGHMQANCSKIDLSFANLMDIKCMTVFLFHNDDSIDYEHVDL